jgi:hypothetical protein
VARPLHVSSITCSFSGGVAQTAFGIFRAYNVSWLWQGLYVFRALLAHPQEVLHKRLLVYCVRIMSVGCGKVAVTLQPCHNQLILYAGNIPNAVCIAPPEDEQVMLETCRGLWSSINWTKSASRWFHHTDKQSVLSCREHENSWMYGYLHA